MILVSEQQAVGIERPAVMSATGHLPAWLSLRVTYISELILSNWQIKSTDFRRGQTVRTADWK